jgi:hypothetical protein
MFVSDVSSQDFAGLERLIQQNFERVQASALSRRHPPPPPPPPSHQPSHFTHIVAPHAIDDGTHDRPSHPPPVQEDSEEIIKHRRRQQLDRSRKIVDNELKDPDTKVAMEIKRLSWTIEDIASRGKTLLRPVLVDFASQCVAWDGLPAELVAVMINVWVSQWSARRDFAELHLRTDLLPQLANFAQTRRIHQMVSSSSAAAGAASQEGEEEEGDAVEKYLRICKQRAFQDKKRDVLRTFFSLKCMQLSQAQKMVSAARMGAEPEDQRALQAEQARQEAERALGIYVKSYLESLSRWSESPGADPAPHFRPPAKAKAVSGDPILDAHVAAANLPASAAPFSCWDPDAANHLALRWEREESEAQRSIKDTKRDKDKTKMPGSFMILRKTQFNSDMKRRLTEKVLWRDDIKAYVPSRCPLLSLD